MRVAKHHTYNIVIHIHQLNDAVQSQAAMILYNTAISSQSAQKLLSALRHVTLFSVSGIWWLQIAFVFTINKLRLFQ